MIHRDIKPNNMKYDDIEGILKIYDFGLAREDGPSASTVGFVGTVGFSAPEQYLSSIQFTQGIDTFAFGATALHYALQGLCAELAVAPPTVFSRNPFKSLPFHISDEIAELLYSCLDHVDSQRPAMRTVCDAIQKHLLFNRHRALVVLNGKPSYLDCERTSVNLKYGEIAKVKISYDGLVFSVSKVTGDVFVNNAKVDVGYVLPGACVLTLGGPELKQRRAYVTFDVSNPEIIV